jgi:hypothetical protein
MKFTVEFPSALTTAIFLLLAIGTLSKAAGQGIGYKPGKDDPEYKLGDLRFQYPKRYQAKSVNGQNEYTVFLSDQKYGDWLFVSVLKDGAELQQTKESLRSLLAANLLRDVSQNLKWKQAPKPYGRFGKYEKEVEKWQALNGKQRLFVESHYLNVKDQDILVGYAFVMEDQMAQSAEAAFNRGLDAGSGPAGEGCSKVIASITGEDDILIGMPPPPAAPPKPKN